MYIFLCHTVNDRQQVFAALWKVLRSSCGTSATSPRSMATSSSSGATPTSSVGQRLTSTWVSTSISATTRCTTGELLFIYKCHLYNIVFAVSHRSIVSSIAVNVSAIFLFSFQFLRLFPSYRLGERHHIFKLHVCCICTSMQKEAQWIIVTLWLVLTFLVS